MVSLKLHLGEPIWIPAVELEGPSGVLRVDLYLDTGAVCTVISTSILRAIGWRAGPSESRVRIVTANGVIHVPAWELPRLTLGSRTFARVRVLAHDIPGLAGAEGLLGLNVLERCRTVLDYRRGRLTIQ